MKPLPPQARLEEDLGLLGLEQISLDWEGLNRFLALLEERSRLHNLIGPREMERVWPRHILESLVYLWFLDPDRQIVDIGTGAGFPGFVLGLLGLDMLLLEPRRKRYLFLRYSREVIGLENVTILRCRVEESGDFFLPGAQFIARAVAEPRRLMTAISTGGGSGADLFCRIPAERESPEAIRCREMPVPPLDRSGILAQYRVPESQP